MRISLEALMEYKPIKDNVISQDLTLINQPTVLTNVNFPFQICFSNLFVFFPLVPYFFFPSHSLVLAATDFYSIFVCCIVDSI